jgi:PAS domain S-box-containing protein
MRARRGAEAKTAMLDVQVRLATFPRDDAAFGVFVRQCWDGLRPEERADPRALERRIRRWHRQTIVHPQVELAALMGQTWYVYRDGHPAMAADEGWSKQPDAARTVFDADGTFVEASDAACRLVGLGPGELVSSSWRDIVSISARAEDAAWIWETLRKTGSVRSDFDCPLPDGRWRTIEYRAEPSENTDRFVSYWRELVTLDPDPGD